MLEVSQRTTQENFYEGHNILMNNRSLTFLGKDKPIRLVIVKFLCKEHAFLDNILIIAKTILTKIFSSFY